ncbi:hypothetical protein D9M68_941930 [compost metagenome]
MVVNRAFSPVGSESAVSSLLASTLIVPPFLISMPMSSRRVNVPPGVMERIMPRRAFCNPTAVLSPCSEPATLVSGSYLVAVASMLLMAL